MSQETGPKNRESFATIQKAVEEYKSRGLEIMPDTSLGNMIEKIESGELNGVVSTVLWITQKLSTSEVKIYTIFPGEQVENVSRLDSMIGTHFEEGTLLSKHV